MRGNVRLSGVREGKVFSREGNRLFSRRGRSENDGGLLSKRDLGRGG